MKLIHLCIFTGLLAAAGVHAQTAPARDTDTQHGPRREPPPQAYQDCKGKKEGDTVQIITPRNEKMAAICTRSAQGLFARPERPPCPEERCEHPPKK